MFQNDNEIAIKQNRQKPKRAGTNKESTSTSSQHQEKEEILLEQEYIDSIIDYDPDCPEEMIENVDFSNYNDSF